MDDVDRQLERDLPLDDALLSKARLAASKIPTGSPGECEFCGEWSGRLVNKACAPCRDKHKLP